MKYVQRLSDGVFLIEKIFSVFLMAIMVISIVTGVTYRYFLNSPLSWPEELAIIMLIWVTFIGGSMSIKRQQAAAVTLFIDRLGPKMKKTLLIAGSTLITVFCIGILYLSIIWITNPSVFMHKLPSLGIAVFYPYLAIPIGFSCMTVHSFNFLFQLFSNK